MNRLKHPINRLKHPPFPFAETGFDVIALAASAGGFQDLCQVLTALPDDFPAALVLVRHLGPGFIGELAKLLGSDTKLYVKEADDGDWLAPGTVFIAPPGHHLLVNPDGTLSLSLAPQVQFARATSDPLFRSLAASCPGRAIGVVLAGGDAGGSLGLRVFRKKGGVVVAQENSLPENPRKPLSAVAVGCVDLVLPLAGIAPALVRLVRDLVPA